jgi:hypothetical protein
MRCGALTQPIARVRCRSLFSEAFHNSPSNARSRIAGRRAANPAAVSALSFELWLWNKRF